MTRCGPIDTLLQVSGIFLLRRGVRSAGRGQDSTPTTSAGSSQPWSQLRVLVDGWDDRTSPAAGPTPAPIAASAQLTYLRAVDKVADDDPGIPALDDALTSGSRGDYEMATHNYDVAIVGGGAAGLSAALVLARARRRVVVVDAGNPRNAPAEHMHNFLSRDGMPPAELLAVGRGEVLGYGAEIVPATVVRLQSTSTVFEVVLENGRTVAARRVLLATGLTDQLPDVPGVRERWGRDVLHCPYCHGYEVRDQPLGVLGTGQKSVHQALLVRQLSSDVVFFRHTLAELSSEDSARLSARDIRVVDGTVARLLLEDDRLTGAQLTDGNAIGRSAMFVVPRFVANDAVIAPLRVEIEHTVLGTWVKTDSTGRTSVPGVWAVGNVADMAAFVVEAAAQGSRAAAAINADLVDEDVARAIVARERKTVGTAT